MQQNANILTSSDIIVTFTCTFEGETVLSHNNNCQSGRIVNSFSTVSNARDIYTHTVKPLKTGPSETGIPSKPNVFRGPVMFVSFNTKVYPSKPETYLNRTGRINPVPLSTFSKNVTSEDRTWGVGGGAELFPWPYPPKVQARPPRDQRLVPRSSVLGKGERV